MLNRMSSPGTEQSGVGLKHQINGRDASVDYTAAHKRKFFDSVSPAASNRLASTRFRESGVSIKEWKLSVEEVSVLPSPKKSTDEKLQ